MLFNSLVFGVFLASVLALHWAWPSRWWTAEKAFLLVASYLFYGWWDARFLLLLAGSSALDYVVTRALTGGAKRRRAWLMASVAGNLGVLGVFKYFNFFAGSVAAMLDAIGLPASPGTLDVVLPVGISFYTFQTMSLSIDAYRGRLSRCPSLLDTSLYVAFFPQLVAGPIVRAGGFFPQIRRKPRARPALFLHGFWLIWLGLFKKTVLADNLAPIVDATVKALADAEAVTAAEAWKAALCFSFQILFDFSGYSDVAVGAAALLGIRFPANFRAPYVAVSMSDFWRRWHISLSTWLRDYLYVPLGGNRFGEAKTYRNLMLTMLLGGLWHGASWNFVLWGGIHGALLSAERRILGRGLNSRPAGVAWDATRCLVIFLLVTLAWVPFRCPDTASMAAMLRAMAVAWPGASLQDLAGQTPILLICAAMVAVSFLRERAIVARRLPAWAQMTASVLMIYSIANHRGGSHAFIYFQF
ncbi:MAG: MBOAT family protein [Planctomycetes bacterium]|nr:MBOAT family protein [Planctomycetota bacterium]